MEQVTPNEIMKYCRNKPGVYEVRPFGEMPICFRVGERIFAQLYPNPDWYKITLKCNPEMAQLYRSTYEGVVVSGYHCPNVQKPYWNTISLATFPKEVLMQMIDEAYEEVISRFTRKQRERFEKQCQTRFVVTDGEDKDFAYLCGKLDENLDQLVGKKFQRQQYAQYNTREAIHDVLLIYDGKRPIGCGSYRLYDEKTVEIKRVYVEEEFRGQGLSKELLRRLEARAKIAGYQYAVLETGKPLETAMKLYEAMGYKRIPNYGPYANMPNSICMEKKL